MIRSLIIFNLALCFLNEFFLNFPKNLSIRNRFYNYHIFTFRYNFFLIFQCLFCFILYKMPWLMHLRCRSRHLLLLFHIFNLDSLYFHDFCLILYLHYFPHPNLLSIKVSNKVWDLLLSIVELILGIFWCFPVKSSFWRIRFYFSWWNHLFIVVYIFLSAIHTF